MENIRNGNKTKEAIKVMRAYLEGAIIQIRGNSIDDWTDCDPNPEWDWMHYQYRIKPKANYRACKNARELYNLIQEHGSWIVKKFEDTFMQISLINDMTPYQLWFDNYTFADGSPIGIRDDKDGD